MTARIAVLCTMLAAANLGLTQLNPQEAPARTISGLPLAIQQWSGEPDVLFDADVERLLRADSYVNRIYRRGDTSLSLYVGYYRSQTQGASIHSPLNCLPGAGWQPTARRQIPIGPGGTGNLVTVEKGDERQIVLYWYRTQKRIIASEYSSKAYLVLDSIMSGRSDAALVRIMAPVPRAANGHDIATKAALAFASSVEPLVGAQLFP